MSWQRQNIGTECLKMIKNTCLETPDTTPNARLRYSSLSEDISSLLALSVCKIRSRNVLTIEKCHSYNVTIHYNARAQYFQSGKLPYEVCFSA